MVKKKAARKVTAKGSALKKRLASKRRLAAMKQSKALRVVLDPGAKPSPYAKRASVLFNQGVQDAYAELAHHGVQTVVVRDGVMIRGVPHRSAASGKFVVGQTSPARAR